MNRHVSFGAAGDSRPVQSPAAGGAAKSDIHHTCGFAGGNAPTQPAVDSNAPALEAHARWRSCLATSGRRPDSSQYHPDRSASPVSRGSRYESDFDLLEEDEEATNDGWPLHARFPPTSAVLVASRQRGSRPGEIDDDAAAQVTPINYEAAFRPIKPCDGPVATGHGRRPTRQLPLPISAEPNASQIPGSTETARTSEGGSSLHGPRPEPVHFGFARIGSTCRLSVEVRDVPLGVRLGPYLPSSAAVGGEVPAEWRDAVSFAAWIVNEDDVGAAPEVAVFEEQFAAPGASDHPESEPQPALKSPHETVTRTTTLVVFATAMTKGALRKKVKLPVYDAVDGRLLGQLSIRIVVNAIGLKVGKPMLQPYVKLVRQRSLQNSGDETTWAGGSKSPNT